MAKRDDPEQEPKLEPLLTSAEVAQILRTTEANLAQWRFRGEGPAYLRFGRTIRYQTADIRTFIEAAREHGRK